MINVMLYMYISWIFLSPNLHFVKKNCNWFINWIVWLIELIETGREGERGSEQAVGVVWQRGTSDSRESGAESRARPQKEALQWQYVCHAEWHL